MLGVFAEFETNLRRERQLEGIAKAKAAGIYKGRKPTVDIVRVNALKQEGLGPSAIARTLGIGRASVYRALGAQLRWSAIQISINIAMNATSQRLGTQTLAEGLAIKLADDCLEFSYISRGTKNL
jgi:DNA invertase Pin-like site-specific DNA recombinase